MNKDIFDLVKNAVNNYQENGGQLEISHLPVNNGTATIPEGFGLQTLLTSVDVNN